MPDRDQLLPDHRPLDDDAVLIAAREVLYRHGHGIGATCTPACHRPSPLQLCHERLVLDSSATPATLRCDLPAGHHSEEHYDRASGQVWLPPGVQPRVRPGLDRPEPG